MSARRRRSLPRRIARIAGITLASLVGLVVLALVFLQTPWGKSFVRGRIEAKLAAAVNGQVSLGSIDYSFLFHDIELGDLKISDAQGRPALGVRAVRVALDRGSLVAGTPVIEKLAIEGLDVQLVKSADGRSNLTGLMKPSKRKPLASIRVEQLSVTAGATITKPDGSTIVVRDLHVAGTLAARPVAKEVELSLRDLGAVATIAKPGAPARELAVSVDALSVQRRADGLALEIAKVVAGAIGIDHVGAQLHLDGKRLAGTQAITLAGLVVDDKRLASLLGRELLADDASIDVSIGGPAGALVVDGEVKTGGARLALDGTVDLSDLARPRYEVALAGTGLRSDLVASPGKERPLVESSLFVHVAGAGLAPGELDARLGVAVGPTKIGKLEVNGLSAAVSAHDGKLSLELLHASAPGVSIEARGALAEDKQVTGRVTVRGTPAEVIDALEAAGIVLSTRVPLPPSVELAIHASGNLEGALVVDLEPTRVRVAGGAVSLAGHAELERKQLVRATTSVGLHRLDLASMARLAGKQPKLTGSVSGTLGLERTPTGKQAAYDLALALDKLGLAVSAKGTANETGLTAKVSVARAKDRMMVATLAASVPLTKRGGKPALRTDGALSLDLDVARRSFAELADLLPARLRGKLPAGDVELHVDIAGTAARPTGTIDVALTARKVKQEQQRVALHADLSSSQRGLALAASGQVWLRDETTPIATLAGTVTTASPVAGGKLAVKALRGSAAIDAVLELPERELASLAFLKAKLAELGGRLDGRIAVKGPLAAPVLDARIAVSDLPTAAGSPARATITAQGTPARLMAKLTHGDAISITAAIDRSAKDRVAIDLAARATHAPLAAALPAFLAPKLGKHQVGTLDWDMTGKLALVRGAHGLSIEDASVAGTLDVKGGAFAVPGSTRRWHDIELSVASEPTGLRIKSLALHERDRQVADRTITGAGFVSLERFKPRQIHLALAARNWLLSGTPMLGMHDAPRATASFDLAIDVELARSVPVVDATVNSLSLIIPDRLDRSHAPELASVSGDIIYLDTTAARAGKLPAAVRPAAAAPRKRRPLDIRIHMPSLIHVQQAPIDITARGELAVRVREDGVTTRGALTVESGSVGIMGRTYKLVAGELAFTDAQPKGQLSVTFEHELPPAVMRQLSLASAGGGARFTLSGSPGNPIKSLGGASNAGLAEAMSINTRGNPVYVSAPDLPASSTVVAPRGDQLSVLSFMAANLPHLLVLDRVDAHSDQYRGASAYGRIEHAELERYSADQKARVRGVVRPRTPGRSSAELQVDRMLINNDRTAVGVGVRAGDRAGGGVGLFVEWSSAE